MSNSEKKLSFDPPPHARTLDKRSARPGEIVNRLASKRDKVDDRKRRGVVGRFAQLFEARLVLLLDLLLPDHLALSERSLAVDDVKELRASVFRRCVALKRDLC